MSLCNSSMEDLPVEVMVDIMSRLPVKTVIECKFVCKKWLNIVSNSYFAYIHLSRSPEGFMIHHGSKKEKNGDRKPGILKWLDVEDELDHHHLHHDPVMTLDLNLIAPNLQKSKIYLVGSVNGLVCLLQYGKGKDNTYICNPITREYMILHGQKCYSEDVGIVYGFGVGSVTKEYKVIRIIAVDIPPNPTSKSRSSLLEAEVYTLGTGQWRSLSHVPYQLDGFSGAFLNGRAHWIVHDEDSPEKICAFDFNKETFESLASPRIETIQESPFNYYRRLGVLKGCLFRSITYDCKMAVWVMKEYGIAKSWHKELVIERSVDPYLDRVLMGCMYIIKGLKDGTVLMASHSEELFAYCPKTKTFIERKISDDLFNGLAHCPSFHRLHNFEKERVHVF